ncbi:MAG: DUF1566 domain-containing protein [Treponema sp.]|jgi:hypothetical protein|nr:DUF1566 domain-containing protein [Treponema sp.]
MNKLNVLFFILFFVTTVLFAQNMSLNAAIQETGKKIQADIAAGALAAVVNIESPSWALSNYIVGELTGFLVNENKIKVVNQENIRNIENEIALQLSGDVSDASIQSIGNRLNADFIITGAFTETAGNYRFRVQAARVSTAVIESVATFTVQNSPELTALLAPDASGVRPGSRSGENSSSQYRIGYYGPAGGIVFYDKGRESGGWRYLEVALAETERRIIWGSGITNVQTTPGIGTGSRNTQRLAQAMRSRNMNETAVLYCDELDFGGFDDWFLPSIEELEQVYKNLKAKGIGDFDDEVYWSSSGNSRNMPGTVNFATGKTMENHAADTARVRAIRAFK